MTTIVVDRKLKLMAADSMMTWGGYKSKGSNKITKFEDKKGYQALVATAGSAEAGVAFDCWFYEAFTGELIGKKKQAYPREKGFFAVVLYQGGRVYVYGFQGYPVEVKDRYFGIGSGSEYALGALHAGASLAEAVRIAAKLDNGTGNRIQVEGFNNA